MDKFDMNQSFLERHKSMMSQNNQQQLPPLFYRVYKSTVQRQLVDVKSLSSYAAYIIILDDERQVLLWVGNLCDDTDVDLLKDLAKDVMTRDYGEERVEEFPIIFEKYDSNNPLLDPLLEILGSTVNIYNSKPVAANRKNNQIENNPISVGVVEPLLETFSSSIDNQDLMNNFELREISFAHPDAQSGTVPRVAFAPVEMNTLVYITIGDQWDLWVARGAEAETVDAAILYLEALIEAQLMESTEDFNRDLIKQYYQITYQGEERVCFRRPLKIFTDFEPPGKTVPRPHTESGPGIGINRRLLEQKQTSNMNSFFNEYRVETENPDDGELDRKASTSISRSASASNFGGYNSNGMVVAAGNDKVVDFFAEVKPPANTVHNFAFNDKFPEEERKKLALLCADVPEVVTIPFDDSKSITAAMVTMVDIYNISVSERKEVLDRAAQDPETLLGWQVEVDEGLYAGIFVIIGYRKSFFRKTFFHLCGERGDDFWVRLRRGNSEHMKKGVKFRPLRKVAQVDRTIVEHVEFSNIINQ